MEVSCPKCQQRLRYADNLTNPLLRCRNCLKTFRPGELASAVEVPVMASVVDEFAHGREEPYQPFVTEPPAETSAGPGSGKGKFGYAAVILVLLLFKAGPRLAREFFREPKPPARPAVRRMLPPADRPAENAGVRRDAQAPRD